MIGRIYFYGCMILIGFSFVYVIGDAIINPVKGRVVCKKIDTDCFYMLMDGPGMSYPCVQNECTFVREE